MNKDLKIKKGLIDNDRGDKAIFTVRTATFISPIWVLGLVHKSGESESEFPLVDREDDQAVCSPKKLS